jgi:predicted glutamine amidotransferase
MCGIFGVVARKDSCLDYNLLQSTVDRLFKLSESRGKEAAGVSVLADDTISIYKEAVPATTMIRESKYKQLFHNMVGENMSRWSKITKPIAVIGHSRLVTNGFQEINSNNQPVITGGMVGVHNGIIVNVNELWNKYPAMERKYEVDSEVILSLIEMYYKNKTPLSVAVQKTFKQIQGAASIAVLSNTNQLILATNTGSLYTVINQAGNLSIFASEKHILKQLIKDHKLQRLLNSVNISHVIPGNGFIVNLLDLRIQHFNFTDKDFQDPLDDNHISRLKIIDYSSENGSSSLPPEEAREISLAKVTVSNGLSIDKNIEAIDMLRRCTKCILPETMPLISFDKKGVCNFCHNYQKINPKGHETLEEILAPYRSKSGEPDCIVSFSGGRDSSYTLHYVTNVLKMKPITYTYDWGMVTDLARRNISRMCGKLGVENILISADIKKKRMNINKNIMAWLKRPELGMIPLFMAGDKQYFHCANILRKQTDIDLLIFGGNKLETTNFKSGFCGIDEKSILYRNQMSWNSKIEVASYYAKQFILNPAYLNSSLFDSLFAFYSYYFMPRGFLYFYEYIKWDENEIMSTLRKEYDWEIATDTDSSWRIGDGTAAFYNYIYYIAAGFNENDTFCSNQIREGMITREEALKTVKKNNTPRYESIEWYCDTIGIDFHKTIKTINSIPKLYES